MARRKRLAAAKRVGEPGHYWDVSDGHPPLLRVSERRRPDLGVAEKVPADVLLLAESGAVRTLKKKTL